MITLLVASLFACAIPEEDFPATYAQVFCRQYEGCEPDDFEDVWDDRDECEDDVEDLASQLLDLADLLGQDYDEDDARDCISNLRWATCDEFSDGDVECTVLE